jgi:CRP-like cAMP-binding protein
MWDLLFKNLSERNVLLDLNEVSILQSYFIHKKFRKNQYILQEGEIAKYESFVVKGLTRTYKVNDKGQEHVLFFGLEDWWIGDLYSFLSDSPSQYNIDCLEDTEVLQVSKQSLNILYEKIPKLNQYFRILLQNAFITTARRVSASLSQTALERYQEFRQKYPHIEQRIPNHQIASFLGITPQSLSRIRRQFAEKK